jgi:antitoxin component of RelBE/YafQ-DinJ toxin-antitoxin module
MGGAIVLEGTARKGKIVIELRNFSNANSYLTGMIIERRSQLSDLFLSRSAAQSLIPFDVRIALETELLLVAAETVQGIAPAAGQAFESENVVTAN